ncbi:MAG: TetR family transcriptional regulator [Halioglobus sp.]|nr:TetR family transcriptional regulator [Halioglobus sp.]
MVAGHRRQHWVDSGAVTAPDITAAPGARERQRRETRNGILNAALAVFAERGFDGARVRDIAAQAGVNHGLIKYYFQNKEQLWKAAVDFLFERLHQQMTEPEEDRCKPRAERVRLWIKRYVRYCAQHPEHARIMVQESIRDSQRLQWAADKHIRGSHQRLLESLPVTLDLRRFPAIDTTTLIYMMNAATQAPFTLAAEIRHLYGRDVNAAQFVDNYADGIFDLFIRPYLAQAREAED